MPSGLLFRHVAAGQDKFYYIRWHLNDLNYSKDDPSEVKCLLTDKYVPVICDKLILQKRFNISIYAKLFFLSKKEEPCSEF